MSSKKDFKKQMSENKISDDNDPVDEFFDFVNNDSGDDIQARELLNADEEGIETRTDINEASISIVNAIILNDNFLKSKGLFKDRKTPFRKYIDNYMKLRISKNRLGREEFRDSIKQHTHDDTLNKLSEFQNINKSKK